MRFSIERKKLKALLAASKTCLPVKPQNENEANPTMRIEGGKLSLHSSDYAQALELTYPVEHYGDFAVSFDLKKMERVIAKTDSGSMEISYEPSKGSLRLSSSEDRKGFVEIPVIPFDNVPVYDGEALGAEPAICTAPGAVLREGLDFSSAYLPAILDRDPKYDFVQIKNGIIASANSATRRGFFVSPSISTSTEVKILKKFALVLPKALVAFPEDGVAEFYEGKRTYTLMSQDRSFVYRCIKARTEPPEIRMEYLATKGAYTTLDLNKLSKTLEKVVIPEYQAAGVSVGVHLVLNPVSGEEGASTLDLSLVTAKRQEAQETLPCARLGEPEGQSLPIDKVVDFKMLREMISSIPEKGGMVKVYMNDPDSKFFRIQNMFSVGTHKCVAMAVGSYARLARV